MVTCEYAVIRLTRAHVLGGPGAQELGMGSSMASLKFLYIVTEDTLVQAIAPLRKNQLTPAFPNKSGPGYCVAVGICNRVRAVLALVRLARPLFRATESSLRGI